MQNWIQDKLQAFAKARKQQEWRKSWTSAVAIFVVVCTLYGLLLPAQTLEYPTYCGLDHEHTEECYIDPSKKFIIILPDSRRPRPGRAGGGRAGSRRG